MLAATSLGVSKRPVLWDKVLKVAVSGDDMKNVVEVNQVQSAASLPRPEQ
jgi:hypothetical protein